MKKRWRARTTNMTVISQLIRMYLTRSVFDIAVDRLLVTFHCLSFGRCIFETKLVLNIVGGHQNHKNRPVATPNEIVDLWQLNTVNTRPPPRVFFFLSLVPGTSELRQFTWC